MIKRYLYKFLLFVFGEQVKIIKMLESRDTEIISEMRKIEGIYDYWEIQKQIGYQFYGKTNDRKYLGWVVLAEHILKNLDNSKLDNLKKADIKEESSNAGGYDSTVEK